MSKVEFNAENVMKCICNTCPVQAKSECAMEKNKKMQEMIAEDIDLASIIGPEDVPGVYCANGKAICNDLYFHEECQCVKCPIFKENNLMKGKPMSYFCRDGEAK